jgi:phage nucleotide-binding protein
MSAPDDAMNTGVTLLEDDPTDVDVTLEASPLTEEAQAALTLPANNDAVLSKLLARISKPEVLSTKLKVEIYGPPGVGKTHFCSTAGRVLLIDVDSGARTLVGTKNVDVLEYVSIEQVEAIVDYMVKGDPAFDEYETIAFDTISTLQMKNIDSQLQRKSKTAGMPIYKADWDIYGEMTQRLRSLMMAFRSIDKNLIVTCHSTEKEDAVTKLMMQRPDLTPKLAATISGLFDIVGYMRIDAKGVRQLQVQPSKTVLAKTRVRLPSEIANPTWTAINK